MNNNQQGRSYNNLGKAIAVMVVAAFILTVIFILVFPKREDVDVNVLNYKTVEVINEEFDMSIGQYEYEYKDGGEKIESVYYTPIGKNFKVSYDEPTDKEVHDQIMAYKSYMSNRQLLSNRVLLITALLALLFYTFTFVVDYVL